MPLNIFALPSVSRLAISAFPNSVFRLSAKYLPAVARTPFHNRLSARWISTPPFQSFVGEKDSRHAFVTRDLIKDAVDLQVQNRPANSTPDERWKDRSTKALDSVARTPPPDTYSGRLFSPHVFLLVADYIKGRTVHVKAMGDLAVAYKQLDGILNRNKVRATMRMNERH